METAFDLETHTVPTRAGRHPGSRGVTGRVAPPRVFRVGELFSGPGGMALGAQHARGGGASIEHVWAVDNDADSCETFRRNLPGEVYCEDITRFDFGRVARVDGLLFGFPCNDFSQVGERLGRNGHYGNLYTHAIRGLEALHPLFFLAENVNGLHATNGRSDYEAILDAFKQAGYETSPRLYSLDEYGIPQTRKRIFIVGFRADLGLPPFVHPTPAGRKTVTCRMALEDKPIGPLAANNERTRQSDQVVERLKHIGHGENAFTADLPAHLRLNVRGAKISQIYRRLDPDRPAYTVTGSGGGGTHMYHWREPRALTNRERARLQTFPDRFVFVGGKEGVRSQIGMAVPPKFATIILGAVLRHLAKNRVTPR